MRFSTLTPTTQRIQLFDSKFPAVFHCQKVTDYSPCLPHFLLLNTENKSSSRTDEIPHYDCHVKFENNTSGRARLWDTALKFLCPGLSITSPDHLVETNLHRLSSPENILNFGKSNAKLHFFGPLSRSVRTLIIKIFSSELPTHTTKIHSDRKVCNFVTFSHLSRQDLFQSVDRPFKNPRAARSK